MSKQTATGYWVRSCKLDASTAEYRDIADRLRCKWFCGYKDKMPVLSDSIKDAMLFRWGRLAQSVASELKARTGEYWETVSLETVHKENQRMEELLREVLNEVEGDEKHDVFV
jgi:hypothetical protein